MDEQIGWLVLVAIVMAAVPAQANPFDVYGSSARSAAMGGAQTANPDGAAAIYDNVAGLADGRPTIQIGAFSTFGDAPIRLNRRPDGYDVPDLGSRSPALPSDQTRRSRRDSESPEPLYGLTAGVVTDFGGTKTRGGVVVMLPTNGLIVQSTHFADERERYFSNQLHHEIIDAGLHRPVIELGVARKLTDRIAFGVGGTYLPGTAVTTEAYVADPADQSDVDLNANIRTGNTWGLLAGVSVELPWEMTAGLAFRQGVAFEMEGNNDVQVRGVSSDPEETRQDLNWVPVFTPSTVRAGLAWAIGKMELTLDGRYTFWSTYLDTQGQDAGFDNNLEGRMGMEWTASKDTRLRAGLGFVPSPVPAQRGRTNYVDNSRLLAAIGGGHGFEFASRTFQTSWYVQFQHLLTRRTDKEQRETYPVCGEGAGDALCDEVPDDLVDPSTGQPFAQAQGLQTGNPGFPGFVSGGWIGSVGIEVRY